MKVLLVDPPSFFLEGRGQTCQVQPLGLGYIGAVLAAEHDVRFLLPDTHAYWGDDPWSKLERVVCDEAPQVIGITAVTAKYPSARRFAAMVNALDPSITIVLGGVHASTDPVGSLEGAPAMDFVVQGEGECTMAELLRALEAAPKGQPLEPRSIRGLFWRDCDGVIRRSVPRPPITDLDGLPYPLRTQLVYDEDISPGFYQAMVTLRGCPYRCIYCAVPSSNDRQTRYRSATGVVDEVAHLKASHGVPCIFFHDSVFSLYRKRTVAICEQLIARDLVTPFHCQTRTDRVDPDLLALMKRAGCQQIFFGIESGTVESLKRIRKKMPLEAIREAVCWVKALDIRCTGFFMIGFPWETRQMMEQTADFATGIGLDAVSLFSATPLPGTELWELAGGAKMPDSIDFRTPQVNATQLSDDEYGDLFAQISGRISTFNQQTMLTSLADGEVGRHSDGRRVSWLD